MNGAERMKFTFLGTAAAEGWPGIFCECEGCRKAKELGGRNIRTRSQAVIDDQLLIDFPADTYLHVLYHGLNLAKIKHCLITHAHSDHLYEAEFEMRRKGFAYPKEESALTVYGTNLTAYKVNNIINLYGLSDEGRVKFQMIEPFHPIDVMNYTVTPLKADHAPICNPVFYWISDHSKNILYANDTGYFPEETWSYLEEKKPYFNLVSLDCTFGAMECRHGHMGLSTNVEVKNRLMELSCADENTIFVSHHFSHNGKLVYDELVPIAEQHNFLVSYDGMTINI
ncbi:hypothetical protein CDQ84_17185 [Clostridium thermosuccinogenes]|jgi:phosphoribosyl 1,2-cyclic phosphate phosphodiesterase|uniref:Metallo-beta-lactamase domain-containing protein n=2 Tax=Clostridium thermosuccinogenes TaxID=84032 RepID=A0A2K2F9D3_9CLOT|nr:hypothetical protein CDO33_02290 [Pseudoclostridium thermosuccinogenes]PNT94777.1 hypothetical protein CDQ85_17085 [Pseudoclostridium thermosuccinogenes]PNT95368.1 hypothetical protein CDQ84_17185 [Pseudoclostridium thermosuccinogenes]